MFGIGGFEFLIIVIVVFLVFGPERMAEGAKTVGKAIGKFRDAQQEVSKVINQDIQNPDPDEPWKKSVEALDKFGRTVTKTVSESTFAGQKAKAAAEAAARDEEQALRHAAQAATEVAPAAGIEAAAEAAGAVQVEPGADAAASATPVASEAAAQPEHPASPEEA